MPDPSLPKPADPKIQHNEAVAQYVLNGSSDPRKLLAVLERLKQRVDDAQADSDAGEGGGADVALGDVDPSLTAYNTAVLLYQLKQFSRCRVILEEMFSNIEPIDEFLVFRVCFLLLDVYLLQKQADKAGEVLSYLERSFLTLTKVEGKENGSADAPADGAQQGAGAAGGGSLASDWPNKKSARRPPTDITPDEVRSALSLYKAKLALMARMSKSSKREIKTTLNACTPNTTGLFLKSNLEYLRQNYRKAVKLLNNSCQKSDRDPNIAALYFNNMGCIHHLMRRHTAAAFYFTRALQENDALYSSPPAKGEKPGVSLPTFACDRRCEIQYNKGLQLLFGGRPEQAFGAFHEALHLLHRQPRIWLRVGETCVATHVQQANAAQAQRQHEGLTSTLVASTIGRGSSRRLVLPTEEVPADEPAAEGEVAVEGAHATASAPAPPSPTLAYGVKCFRNALLLCETSGQLGDYAALQRSSAQGTLTPSEELALGLHSVQRLAMLQLSWCALTQDDHAPALSWATALLGLDDVAPNLKFYAHLYASAALCELNRGAEALQHLLDAMRLGDVAQQPESPPPAEGDGVAALRNPYSPVPQSAQAASHAAARAVLHANLATVHIMQGDLPQASQCAHKALELQPDSRNALLCLVYLEIRGGNLDAAREILTKHVVPSQLLAPAAS